MSVERFSSQGNPNGLGFSNGIVSDVDGGYVRYRDYEALREELAKAEREKKELLETITECRRQINSIIEDGVATDWHMWRDDLDAVIAKVSSPPSRSPPMQREAKLTKAQVRVLKNLNAGLRSDHGFKRGRSTAGGLSGTFLSLSRRGLIVLGTNEYRITPAGIRALEAKDNG